jgi:hypothetical protein
MKKITQGAYLVIFLLAVNAVSSCKKVDGCTNAMATNFNSSANVDNGSCQYIVTFYTDDVLANNIGVTLSSSTATYQVQTISQVYTNSGITCGAAGCANYSLPLGTYSYTATSPPYSWSGSFTLAPNACNLVPLGTASVTFWTASTSAGTITVNLTGYQTATFSTSFSSAPTCGSTGCANFLVPSGANINYTASSTSGSTWSGTVTPTNPDQCYTYQLQ